MKKILLLLLLLSLITPFCLAQTDIQFLYDCSKYRHFPTTTIEMFKADKWGSTYFFVDLHHGGDSRQMNSAYTEISREMKLGKSPLSAHVEYDGGLWNSKDFSVGGPINNAYLLGVTYTFNAKDFSKGIAFTPMYKYISNEDQRNNYQLTAVWYWNMCNKLITFSGFVDWWREKTIFGKHVFMSQPQWWYNLNHYWKDFNLSLGGEMNITCNFYKKGWNASPCLGAKWTF